MLVSSGGRALRLLVLHLTCSHQRCAETCTGAAGMLRRKTRNGPAYDTAQNLNLFSRE